MIEIPEAAVEAAQRQFDWSGNMKTALKVAAPLIREDERRRIAESIGAKGYQVGEKRFPDNRAHGDDEWPYRHFTDGIDLAIEIAVQITERNQQ